MRKGVLLGIKRILYITDDYSGSSWESHKDCHNQGGSIGEYYNFVYNKRDSLKKSINILKKKQYDLVLIDYGLIGDEWDLVREFWNKYNIMLTGFMPESTIKDDAKEHLPDIKINIIDAHDMTWYLYSYFKELENI